MRAVCELHDAKLCAGRVFPGCGGYCLQMYLTGVVFQLFAYCLRIVVAMGVKCRLIRLGEEAGGYYCLQCNKE